MSDEYLTVTQIAERLGIQVRSVYQSRWRRLLPEPDLILLNHPLWLTDTIDNWRNKTIKQRKRRRKRIKTRVTPKSVNALPSRAKLSTAGASSLPLPQATITADMAAGIAAALRNEGHHCTTRDVQELAQADPDDLDYDTRKLQQRVMRKVRAAKGL